eukprot:1193547-Prorocentrum_minimum.AAC.1
MTWTSSAAPSSCATRRGWGRCSRPCSPRTPPPSGSATTRCAGVPRNPALRQGTPEPSPPPGCPGTPPSTRAPQNPALRR